MFITSHSMFETIEQLMDALRIAWLSSKAYTGKSRRQGLFQQQIVHLLSANSNYKRVSTRYRNSASKGQSAGLSDSVSPYMSGLRSFRLGFWRGV